MIPKNLLVYPFTRKRLPTNSDGRADPSDLLEFSGYRSKKRRFVPTAEGKYEESTSAIVPRDQGLDIQLDDRIFEGHLASGDPEGRAFTVIGKDTGVVPGGTSTHHEQIYIR